MYHHCQYFQPGRLSGPMRREMEKGLGRPGQPEIYRIVELDLPTGTRYLSDGTPVQAAARAKPRVTRWGNYNEGFDLRTSTLGATELTLTIDDTDRDFAKEYSKRAGTLRGSAVRIKRISPNVPNEGDWYTEYAGVLKDWQPGEAPLSWNLRIGPNDDAIMNGFVPDVAVTKAAFPNAHQSALGQYPPRIYGVHNSQGFTAQGFVPTLYVDTVGFVYLVALGKVNVMRVFKDGVQQSSGYSITYVMYGGRLYTCIDFTSDQGSASITADVEGLTDKPDGTGSLLVNPADVFKHAAAQFFFGQWPGYGSYLAASSAQLDLRSFARAREFFADHPGSDLSKWIGGSEQTKILDFINECATSHEFKLFWTNENKLAMVPLDYRPVPEPYSAEQWIREVDVEDSFRQSFDSSAVISRISLQTAYGQVAGRYFNELPVSDLSAGVDVTESKQAAWSKAAVQ